MVRVILINNGCIGDNPLLFGRKSGVDKIISAVIYPIGSACIRRRTVTVEPGTHSACFPCYALEAHVILKHIQILIGKQEQLPVGIGQYSPFNRVNIISVVSVTALLVCAEIDVVCLSAADICGGSAIHKLDCLACVRSCRKRRCGHKPYNKADRKQ